jgi:hypothetical protein
MNTETKRMTLGAQAQLLTMMVQKLYRSPSLSPGIMQLHHGSYKSVDVSHVDGVLVVDT